MIPSIAMHYLFESTRKLLLTTWPSALVALAAWVSLVISLDPAGSYPGMLQGPGLTIDEVFNVDQGVYLIEQAQALGWFNLIPGTSIEAFRREQDYNPDHPPLGRYWLGLHHQLTWWIAPPFQPDGPYFVTACARTGSATAFALTIWLIGTYVSLTAQRRPNVPGRLCPEWQGAIAAIALVLMPRLYGHAHLAALETITNLTCTAAVLAVAFWWNGARPPSTRVVLFTGLLLGCALLTKIQAVLIPIPVIVWALFRWRQRSFVPLLLWLLVAGVVFFAGWPYLWLDPGRHLLEYLGRTTDRVTLKCYYFGTTYTDRLVPWHYPFVMFAVTVPISLQLLGLVGLASRTWKTDQTADARQQEVWQKRLLLACGLFPLLVFSLPGIAVYDGERLFLTVFPLWAIFIGKGAVSLRDAVSSRLRTRWASAGLVAILAAQVGINLQSHPAYLSYYNLAVGGTAGAERMGMELNYWGDSLSRDLLQAAVDEHGEFTTVEIRPSLHQFQEVDLIRQSPILRSRLSRGHDAKPLRLVFRRRADLTDDMFQTYKTRGTNRLAGFQ